jgi:hypothetical protein
MMPPEKILKKSFENPKVLQNAAVKGRQPVIRPEFASMVERSHDVQRSPRNV